MSTSENNIPFLGDQTPLVSPGNYSPVTVTVKRYISAIFLGILSVVDCWWGGCALKHVIVH